MTPKNPVRLGGTGDLLRDLLMCAMHPKRFPVPELEDGDPVGVGRVRPKGDHIVRIDVHGGPGIAVDEWHDHGSLPTSASRCATTSRPRARRTSSPAGTEAIVASNSGARMRATVRLARFLRGPEPDEHGDQDQQRVVEE